MKNLEPGVTYHVLCFDPATGRRFDQGTVMYGGPTPPPFAGHTTEHYHAPDLPSPQDWVLVLERAKP